MTTETTNVFDALAMVRHNVDRCTNSNEDGGLTEPTAAELATNTDENAYLLAYLRLRGMARTDIVVGQRVCTAGNSAHGGTYQYPPMGWAVAPDWRDHDGCGNGLHFCGPDDSGSFMQQDCERDSWRFLAVIALASETVRIDDEKRKASRLFVIKTDGSQAECAAAIREFGQAPFYDVVELEAGAGYIGKYGSTVNADYRNDIIPGPLAIVHANYRNSIIAREDSKISAAVNADGDRAPADMISLIGGRNSKAELGYGANVVSVGTMRITAGRNFHGVVDDSFVKVENHADIIATDARICAGNRANIITKTAGATVVVGDNSVVIIGDRFRLATGAECRVLITGEHGYARFGADTVVTLAQKGKAPKTYTVSLNGKLRPGKTYRFGYVDITEADASEIDDVISAAERFGQ